MNKDDHYLHSVQYSSFQLQWSVEETHHKIRSGLRGGWGQVLASIKRMTYLILQKFFQCYYDGKYFLVVKVVLQPQLISPFSFTGCMISFPCSYFFTVCTSMMIEKNPCEYVIYVTYGIFALSSTVTTFAILQQPYLYNLT